MAADSVIKDQTLYLTGLQQPVKVTLEADGTAHIVAQTDHDLFLATGYVHARFRLFQMDLMRRQGEGLLSEVVGKDALESDRFELQLGLLRTAQLEWSALAPDNRSRQALIAYAQGVNDRIAQAESDHQLPVMFTLLGYHPKQWTPIDTLSNRTSPTVRTRIYGAASTDFNNDGSVDLATVNEISVLMAT